MDSAEEQFQREQAALDALSEELLADGDRYSDCTCEFCKG